MPLRVVDVAARHYRGDSVGGGSQKEKSALIKGERCPTRTVVVDTNIHRCSEVAFLFACRYLTSRATKLLWAL